MATTHRKHQLALVGVKLATIALAASATATSYWFLQSPPFRKDWSWYLFDDGDVEPSGHRGLWQACIPARPGGPVVCSSIALGSRKNSLPLGSILATRALILLALLLLVQACVFILYSARTATNPEQLRKRRRLATWGVFANGCGWLFLLVAVVLQIVTGRDQRYPTYGWSMFVAWAAVAWGTLDTLLHTFVVVRALKDPPSCVPDISLPAPTETPRPRQRHYQAPAWLLAPSAGTDATAPPAYCEDEDCPPTYVALARPRTIQPAPYRTQGCARSAATSQSLPSLTAGQVRRIDCPAAGPRGLDLPPAYHQLAASAPQMAYRAWDPAAPDVDRLRTPSAPASLA